jgi:hypothetical protein
VQHSPGFERRLSGPIKEELARAGWAYLREFQPNDARAAMLALAGELGRPLLEGGAPLVVETKSAPDAPIWEPFNRPEAIGWHNDFSTWSSRPNVTLATVLSVPEHPEGRGDWRVASVDDVARHLEKTASGRAAIAYLEEVDLPFCMEPGEPVHHHRVLRREGAGLRVRFYARALRLGCAITGAAADGVRAVAAWEAAADEVGIRLDALPGALLVSDNWRAMHDRLAQGPGRTSLLCFVDGR